MDAKPTDEELLSAFVSGEQEALGELARRHESSLLGLAGGLLGGPALACDAVQEAWIRRPGRDLARWSRLSDEATS